ncbi:DoxX family protein [Cellulophaga sp. E16_2]|uniref:DoxX family protein n=1 Tax=Cellulophaga algicola (strain DSM 14237 / IC166 / ACAM 630) TaxID=688270 RepID=E6XAS0_CELAD|nr:MULTISPECIES: DoxX family protein [Cellulophaga]ADV51032.1 DoxX family protein [Cellulophaga algicola DSM 14237]MBO0593425.1 DoxX family protein [Cellulophaga sp. E16_2]
MQKKLFNEIGLALLRIVPSVIMITHGIPKFQKLISGNLKFQDPIGIGEAPSLFLAVIAELVCPILIIIGFKTRWAALPTAITMGVAAFISHGSDALKEKELALLYLTFFVVIMLVGPGKYSIDKK